MSFAHACLRTYHEIHRRRFAKSIWDLEGAQRKTLARILNSLRGTQKWGGLAGYSYEDLAGRIPVLEDSEMTKWVAEQRQNGKPILCEKVRRYEPTSGSMQKRKWVPYSSSFLSEINVAASAWLGDLYSQYPEIRKGRHYWSLSWLPLELRLQGMNTDDADLFPLLGRLLIHRTMAASPLLNRVSTPEASWWATLLMLASAEDLTMVSVWSPTFWLRAMADLEKHESEISELLAKGSWGKFQSELQPILGAAPQRILEADGKALFEKLWPKLALISCWDSSTSRQWSEEIRMKLPGVNLQGKGLWATEGVVTIPFQGQNTLAICSHFFEFRDLDTQEILPSWRVQLGQVYQPLLWTSSGLLRYALQDRVEVVGLSGQTPVLRFLGRLRGIDLVGEKMGIELLEQLLATNPHWKGICVLAVRTPQPRYVLLQRTGGSADGFEAALSQHHHYRVARELGQLAPAEMLAVENIEKLFLVLSQPGMVIGQTKFESAYLMEKFPDLN